MTDPRPESGSLPSWLSWVGLVLLTLCGALSAAIEAMLVPLYVGATVLPVTVLVTVVLNLLLPRLARVLVDRSAAAVAPVLAWVLVILLFGSTSRPEGDVIMPGGGPGGVEWVTYGVLLGGVAAAAVGVVLAAAPAQRRTGRGDLKERGDRSISR